MALKPRKSPRPAVKSGTKIPDTRKAGGDDDDTHEGFSYSVNRSVDAFDPEQRVSSWAITKELCKLHPEYGAKTASRVKVFTGPADFSERPVTAWLDEVQKVVLPGHDGIIHGRLVILGLAKIDPVLREYLTPSGLVPAIERELAGQPIYSREPTSPVPSDPTPLHIDNPAAADQLGRKAFARALALRLGRIWKENYEVKHDSSFVLHLHGPWGSGKSSLLNLLRHHLQPPPPNVHTSRWIVVEFNAWQNQRINPPWWPLLDTVYRQTLNQLLHRYRKWGAWCGLRFREFWWRFITANREHLFLAISVLILTAIVSFLAWHYWPRVAAWAAQASPVEQRDGAAVSRAVDISGKAISAVLGIVGVIATVASFATRSLLSGSAGAAQRFVRSAVDPMARITRHFRELVTWIDRPIIIFIDDLDRCKSEYVLNLLEGVQTLFKDHRVMYVIAADRRWIYACYENIYEKFATAVREPGRDLGCLFLEKAVQLSVSLPRLSDKLQTEFWDFLVNGEPQELKQKLDEAAVKARKELEGLSSPEEIAAKLGPPADTIEDYARREEAVIALASERAETSTKYFLRDFALLLEKNPRAMKRLLNAYALHRDMAVLSGLNVLGDLSMRTQLVLWTIVCLRWPLLEQALSDNPDYVDGIYGPQTVSYVPKAVRSLLERDSVKAVFNGVGDIKLEKKTIDVFANLRTSNSSSAAVG